MSKSETKFQVDAVALAEFLAGLEREGLIHVNRRKLRVKQKY
jgi:hypothetical protein